MDRLKFTAVLLRFLCSGECSATLCRSYTEPNFPVGIHVRLQTGLAQPLLVLHICQLQPRYMLLVGLVVRTEAANGKYRGFARNCVAGAADVILANEALRWVGSRRA